MIFKFVLILLNPLNPHHFIIRYRYRLYGHLMSHFSISTHLWTNRRTDTTTHAAASQCFTLYMHVRRLHFTNVEQLPHDTHWPPLVVIPKSRE
jgi:hypothetical protein